MTEEQIQGLLKPPTKEQEECEHELEEPWLVLPGNYWKTKCRKCEVDAVRPNK